MEFCCISVVVINRDRRKEWVNGRLLDIEYCSNTDNLEISSSKHIFSNIHLLMLTCLLNSKIRSDHLLLIWLLRNHCYPLNEKETWRHRTFQLLIVLLPLKFHLCPRTLMNIFLCSTEGWTSTKQQTSESCLVVFFLERNVYLWMDGWRRSQC